MFANQFTHLVTLRVKKLCSQNFDKNKIIKVLNEKDISKVEIYYFINDNVASRVKIDESFNSSKIKTITDSGIQKIMKSHLVKFDEDKNGKTIEHPELAFSADGLDELNKNIISLNNGKYHQPIYKVRTYETKGNKFNVGNTGNKKDKFVEAAKGTNLFFAIYSNSQGKRNYETVPLNIVIENQKQGALENKKPEHCSVPERNENGDSLLFHLSPNDLVYVPSEEERINPTLVNFDQLNREQIQGVYKIVSFTSNRLYAIPCNIATSIVDKFEFTQLNKVESSLSKVSIKEFCWKLEINRIGKIKRIIK